MKPTSILKLGLSITLASATLNAATVSVVNQTATSTPSGATTSPTSFPQTSTTGTGAQGQQKTAGAPSGKLPPSKSSGTSTHKPKIQEKEPILHPEEPTYTYPGLLAKIGKRWVGNDYLYNMHRNIGIVVEVFQLEGQEIPIDKEALKRIVAEIFEKGAISPISLASEYAPPLPFFHVLIFAHPSDNANTAFVSGRLFEDAMLARYGLDPIGTWQAISWEKQDFVISSPLQFDEQLKKSVANIAQTFLDRVEMYARIKEESESDAKLYYPKAIPTPAALPSSPSHP